MDTIKSERGFIFIMHRSYPNRETKRLISESSAIGDYEDAFENPGSSYLWVGENHHLDRDEVRQLIQVLEHWLRNKRLPYGGE